ncbi:hypothetical protein DFH06DRAFT_1035898 [Mycena polygramma]|nr:hypothetical protein DFH06DRAFT_1035898 [Mycena polygramma]
MTSKTALLAQAVQSLVDPRHPQFCCRYYICLLSHIEPENDFWDNPIVRDAPYASEDLRLPLGELTGSNKLIPLFDVISPFLTIDRCREDMAALARRMEHCDCDRTDRLVDAMHAWHWNPTAYCLDPPGFGCRACTLEGLIAIIADLVFNALQMRGLEPRSWPRHRRRCLAGNDEAAATMLCRWLDVYPILPILRAIVAAGGFGRDAVVVPLLLSAHLPKNLVTILKRGLDLLPPDYAGDPYGNAFGVVYPITLVFFMMREFSTIDDGVSSAYFYREYCPLLLECLNRVAELNEKMGWVANMDWERGLHMGGVVHAKLVLPFDETKYHRKILHFSRQLRTGILDVQTPYQLARNIMFTLAELPSQCMDSSCAAPTAVLMCSGCKRVAYCNPQCQTHDWNGPLPHKKVCKKIRALGDAAGFPMYATPKAPPPPLEVHEFQRRVQNAVPWREVKTFNECMIEDDRIRKVVNDKYSARYQRSLD